MNFKKLLPIAMVMLLASMVSAEETDFTAVGANITAAIGLIGNVIDGIVSIVPNLMVIIIMLAIAGFATIFLRQIVNRIRGV